MIQKIVGAKEPSLREKSKPVKKIDRKILGLIADLHDTLVVQKDPEGVGLAAPQIGKNLRIFVINYGPVKRTVVNPEIINVVPEKKRPAKKGSKKRINEKEILEGCLSLPNYYSPLKRAKSVTIKYWGEKGKEVTEEFKGFYAQIVLHEIDHLDGILFVDRLLEQKKPLYKLEGKEWQEVELV